MLLQGCNNLYKEAELTVHVTIFIINFYTWYVYYKKPFLKIIIRIWGYLFIYLFVTCHAKKGLMRPQTKNEII